MQRKSLLYLSHMLEAATSIQEFVRDRSVDDLSSDRMLRSAIYYEFTVTGEALSQLRAIDPPTADRITDAGKIIGFRNQIIHGYAVIQDTITWKVIKEHLPVLVEELTLLLGEA